MKKILLLVIPLLLVSCSGSSSPSSNISSGESSDSSSSESSSPESSTESSTESSGGSSESPIEPTLTHKTAKLYESVYNSTEDDFEPKDMGALSYVLDEENYGSNRAFISVSSFFSLKCSQTYEVTVTSAETVFSFSGNIGKITFSRVGEVTFTNREAGGSLGATYPLDLAATTAEENTHTQIKTYTVTENIDITHSLSKYSLPYYFEGSDVYLPTSVFGPLFLYAVWSTMAFNGLDFFLLNDCTPLAYGAGTAFSDLYYSSSQSAVETLSPMTTLTTKTEAEANLDANSFFFTIDMLYGFSENEEFSDGYAAYLQKNYPDVYSNLYSTDVDTALSSYDSIINTIMGDGHSRLYNNGNAASFYNGGKHNISAPITQRVNKLGNDYRRLLAARQTALGLSSSTDLGDHYLDIKGETAIIRFDSFVVGHIAPNQDASVYEANIKTDNFSLFYTAFKKIEETGGVKNVIVDLTCNLGGDSVGLMAALGFIVEDNYGPMCDYVSKKAFRPHYLTDCNADGVFEEGESPAGNYNQFVLTSSCSFSCGNAFPAYAKMGGVKTIGTTSGGGGYAVYPYLTSEGYPIQISGPFSIGRQSFEDPSVDSGVTPDIAIEESDYYDIDKLAEAISSAQ